MKDPYFFESEPTPAVFQAPGPDPAEIRTEVQINELRRLAASGAGDSPRARELRQQLGVTDAQMKS